MDTANTTFGERPQWSHDANDACWLDSLFEMAGRMRNDAEPSSGLRVCTVFASLPEQLRAADELVRRRYAWRGYHHCATSDAAGSLANGVTLLAKSGKRLLGTLTVRAASSRALFAEQSYAEEIESLRRQGRRVGELVRLAMEEGADWRIALDSLVHSAYVLTRFVHSLTDVVIEVNPRHVRFYKRVFGFVSAAAERFCTRVGAPSVLMRLDLDHFGKRLETLHL